VAAGAADFLAGRLALSPKPGGRLQLSPDAAKHLTPKSVALAMRTFASAALIVLGPGKDQLLRVSQLDEAAWMQKWRFVFDYQPDDMRVFNEVLLPAWHGQGLDGLMRQAVRLIDATLCHGEGRIAQTDTQALKNALLRDVFTILRLPDEEASHAVCDRC
jgi:hypothetical protein